MKEKLVIIGGGGHAKVLISIIKKGFSYDIVGYVDKLNYGDILNVKYLGDDFWLEANCKSIKYAALGIGQISLTENRNEVVNRILKIGYEFPKIISPYALVNDGVKIGDGVQVFDGAVINSSTEIDAFSIINTNSTIEHDCKIGKFCHIATGATLCGGVEIGDFSMIGSNSVVVQYKRIASRVLIGSGGVVVKDIIEAGSYVGNPVRKIK